MKIAEEILWIIHEDFEDEVDTDSSLTNKLTDHLDDLGFEGIEVLDVSESEEDETVTVTFGDEENELVAVFFKDDEGKTVVTVIDSPEDLESDEVDVIDLEEFNPAMKENGLVDVSNTDWLTEELVEAILSFDSMEERSITVIRKGKKVRKVVKRKIRRKRLSAKRKQAIKRGVRKRKKTKARAQRKRKRSLAIRKRSKLKKKPKNLRVVG